MSNWMNDALCIQTDPEVFFVDEGRPNQVAVAKKICGDCPVKDQCLQVALQEETLWLLTGIWGGTTTAERVNIKKQQLLG